jgi:hypothetical protein
MSETLKASEVAAANAKFSAIFSNGVGEAGLEVGADPGLPADEYIQIPQCMMKAAVFRRSYSDYDVVDLKATEAAREREADKARAEGRDPRWVNVIYEDPPVTHDPEEGDKPEDMEKSEGWFRSKKARIYTKENGEIARQAWSEDDLKFYAVDLVMVSAPTVDDVRAFVQVNLGHMRDGQMSAQQLEWVVAIRFWAVVGGLVTSSKNKEWVVVPNPTSDSAPIDIDRYVRFIEDYSSSAYTACAARGASYRKTNHATGGDTVQGFPAKWMQREGYLSKSTDKTVIKQENRKATTAFYVATHGVSVHCVLAQMGAGAKYHWCEFDPSCGMMRSWEMGDSARVRMEPNTQVAGGAIVADSMVILEMMVKDGIAPLLVHKSQVSSLANAYKRLEKFGVACAVYARWFFDGSPYSNWDPKFSQKDPAFSDLAGELAIVGTKYYTGSTIGASASLENAARQSNEEDLKATWAKLGAERRTLAATDIERLVKIIKGNTSKGFIRKLLSDVQDDNTEGEKEYNEANSAIAHSIGMNAELVPVLSLSFDYESDNEDAAA